MTKTQASSESIDHDAIEDALALASTAAKKLQFKVAQGHAQVLLSLFPGLKTALRTYTNTLTSINEGLTDGALTKKGAVTEAEMANNVLREAVHKATDALSQPAKYDPDVLYKDLSQETLKVYDENMNSIQTTLNKRGLFVGYAPVLPIMQPPLDATKLKRAGIPSESFAGYTILKKEFVAGITAEELKKLMSEQPGPGMSEAKKKKLEEEALVHFREAVEAKYKHLKLTQMGNVAGWWGAYWFWYATSAEFKVLKACTINSTAVSSLKISRWNFPFHR